MHGLVAQTKLLTLAALAHTGWQRVGDELENHHSLLWAAYPSS